MENKTRKKKTQKKRSKRPKVHGWNQVEGRNSSWPCLFCSGVISLHTYACMERSLSHFQNRSLFAGFFFVLFNENAKRRQNMQKINSREKRSRSNWNDISFDSCVILMYNGFPTDCVVPFVHRHCVFLTWTSQIFAKTRRYTHLSFRRIFYFKKEKKLSTQCFTQDAT